MELNLRTTIGHESFLTFLFNSVNPFGFWSCVAVYDFHFIKCFPDCIHSCLHSVSLLVYKQFFKRKNDECIMVKCSRVETTSFHCGVFIPEIYDHFYVPVLLQS